MRHASRQVLSISRILPRPAILAALALGLSIAGAHASDRPKPQPERRQDLSARVSQLVSTARLGNAQVGISIVDLSTGRTLYEQNAGDPFIPASNQKLLTSAAALTVLGPEFVFKTELLVDGERLIVRGSGDPALGDPAVLSRMQPRMSVETLLSTLAQSLPKASVTKVSEIIVDDRVFEREGVHPTWPKDQLDNWYCAEVSGLNFHANVLSFFATPVRAGAGTPATLAIEPESPWLDIDNRSRSAATGKNALWIRRDQGTNKFTVSGEVAAPIREAVEVTLHDVPTYFGQLLAAELPKAGVMVGAVPPVPEGRRLPRADLDSVIKLVRLAQSSETLDGKPVAVVTTSIKDVVDRCNADSQNLYAESLLKRLGHAVTSEPGSWTSGASVVRMTISQQLSPDAAASTVIADGSGMSRDNRVAPRTLTQWLSKMQGDARFGALFVDSLAAPGEGTLRKRFNDAKLTSTVRAKSGRLNNVRCLSGYVTGPDGRRVAFSIMINNLQRGEIELNGKDLTEDVVIAIDRWLASQRGSPAPR